MHELASWPQRLSPSFLSLLSRQQSEVDPVSVVETLLRLVIVGPQAPLGLRLFLPTDTRAILRAVRAAASGSLGPGLASTFNLSGLA